MKRVHAALAVLMLFGLSAALVRGDEAALAVELDTGEVPELRMWGETARGLIVAWQPRFVNLLGSKGFVPARRIQLRLRKSERGIAATAGQRIEVSSHWIESHPEDTGLVVHELVHVVQAYPKAEPLWITEGIADYLRWAIYEGKPQAWFPVSRKPQGYRDSYRVAAGFLLWLESDAAPGIVRILNAQMRRGTYNESIFQDETGRTLDELWTEYLKAHDDAKTTRHN